MCIAFTLGILFTVTATIKINDGGKSKTLGHFISHNAINNKIPINIKSPPIMTNHFISSQRSTILKEHQKMALKKEMRLSFQVPLFVMSQPIRKTVQ